MSRLRSDIEYKLNHHLNSIVKEKYHIRNSPCPKSRRSDLNRDLGLKLSNDKRVTCFQVFKLLYLMWLELGLNDIRPDAEFLWTVYHDFC